MNRQATALLWAAMVSVPASVAGQNGPPWVRVAGQVIPLFTTSTAVPGGGPLAELRLAQPVLMLQAGALNGRLQLDVMGDFEGWTLPNGELSTGAYGEGYMDRRHPHTFVHELMLSARDLLGALDGRASLSLAAGKGFVPFGTDDPMSRPPMLYPVNHHLAQVLERAVVVAALRAGPVTLEGATFNGDEPERPAQWPNWDRFGDSWATRVTAEPVAGLEWQLSRAHVHSPEHRLGAGTDAEKWSTSLRWERGPRYTLLEWARTSEAGGAFVFHSLLAEGAWRVGAHRPYVRLERTERPEEQRAGDPFRATRPHLDNSLLGITRWTIGTVGYGMAFAAAGGRLTLQPTMEAALARVSKVTGLFDPGIFYRRSRLYSLNIGVRVDWGMAGHRMGHYAAPTVMAPGMNMPGMSHD